MTSRPVVVLLLMLSSFLSDGPDRADAAEWPATVVTVAGVADTLRKGQTAWTKAELRDELGEGDAVRTGPATRLTLRTLGGHSLRLGPGTRLGLLGDRGAGDEGPPRVRMTGGWLWVAALPAAGAGSQLEVEVGPVTVGIGGGGVAIRVNRDGSVLVRVAHGAAVCAGPGDRREWERRLGDRQEIAVPVAGVPGLPLPLTAEPIEAEWVKWNEDQDRAGGYGSRPPGR